MTKKRILLSSPHMSEEGYEQAFVQEAFDTNWIAPLGENVNQFEVELAEYVKSGYASALTSGTAAIHLALKLAGVGTGDVVLCQSLTFSATANPIMYQGATPVFIDSELDTWNMDPVHLEAALKKHRPKAVLLVHLYGQCAKITEIKALCEQYDAVLIEDAAESLGTTYEGKQTGTFGKYGIYSFNGNKIITTSGGGMLVSDDESDMAKSRFWATQSRENARHYQHEEVGYNYRMSNVVAGIGRGQLKVLDDRVSKKREIFERYVKHLGHLEGVSFPVERPGEYSNHWLTPMLVTGAVSPIEIMDELEKHNIESRPVWKPMHMQPVFSEYEFFGTDVSQRLFETGICLPSDTKMTEEEQMRVIDIIRGLLQ